MCERRVLLHLDFVNVNSAATSGSGQTPTSSPASSEFSLTLHSTESLSPGVTLSTAECDGSFTPFGVGAETFSGEHLEVYH